jgi:ferritin-like metal-binding protein YciE
MLPENLSDLFQRGLELAYGCERHIVKELPHMVDSISSATLRKVFEDHLEETKTHLERLEKVFSTLERVAVDETDHTAESITREAEKMIKHIDRSPLLDAAIIMSGNQLEHHEIALYGSLHSLARLLGKTEAASLLEQTLNEEKTTDQAMTQIAESLVNSEAIGFENSLHGIARIPII